MSDEKKPAEGAGTPQPNPTAVPQPAPVPAGTPAAAATAATPSAAPVAPAAAPAKPAPPPPASTLPKAPDGQMTLRVNGKDHFIDPKKHPTLIGALHDLGYDIPHF